MAREDIAAFVARLPAGPSPERSLFRVSGGEVSGQFYGSRLASVFQPVVRRDGGLVGHQGLVRCCHGSAALELSPWRLFADAAGDAELVQLDRLARTVHALNYFGRARDDWRLFLAVEQRLLDAVPGGHGRAYRRILSDFGIAPGRVVITLPESANANRALLAEYVANYRYSGYRVAVRVAAVAPGEVEAVAHLGPDIVRLRFAAVPDEAWRDTLAAIRAAKAVAHVTHIEDPRERARLAALGADWLQGWAVGLPTHPGADWPAPARVADDRAPARAAPVEARHTPRFAHMQPGDLELPLWPPFW